MANATSENATVMLPADELHRRLEADRSSSAARTPGAAPAAAATPPPSLLETLDASPPVAIGAETLPADSAAMLAADRLGMDSGVFRSQLRTTVLPMVEFDADGQPAPVLSNRERYETLGRLGEGGIGEVLLVRDNDIQRKVAMKRVKADVQNFNTLLRFAEEIRTIGQLDHPNIVPIHDVGLDPEGQHFFIMKHIDGETLEDVIEKLRADDPKYHARFPMHERLSIFKEMLRAVRFAHNEGFIHRDIKPANIMVGPMGEVVVMDWGLAKNVRPKADRPNLPDVLEEQIQELSELPEIKGRDTQTRFLKTQDGAVIGTPAYMSPEQAKGENATLGIQSDIYSLCATFYEFLTLKHYLGDQESLQRMLLSIVTREPEFPVNVPAVSKLQEGVPAELSHFIMRGLAKDPGERWESIDAMIAEIHLIESGQCHIQCPVTLAKRTNNEIGRFIDRHPQITMGAVMMAPFLLLLSVVATIVALIN